MAELEIDQSNLPRVEEVCQSFAVLEDGALAHNLQEQEIEQYYTANVQKNQLVQRDIRIARQLQNEEQDRLQHLSRQREEQDSEYARLVQEELQRCAEEARRREEEDQEIAKCIQEEEELRARRRVSCQSSATRDSTVPGLSYPTRLDHAWAREQDRRPRHWHPPRDRRPPSPSPSPPPSDLEYWSERNPDDSEYWPERNPDDSEYWPEQNHNDDRYSDDQLTDDQFTLAQHPEDHYQEDQYPEVQPPMRRGRPTPVVGPAETVALGAPFSGSWADALRLIKQDMSEHGLVECPSSGDNLPSTPLQRLERVVLSHEQREAAVERRSSHRSSYREDRRVCGGREDEDRGEGYGNEQVGWRSEPRALRHSASVCCSSSRDARRPVRPLERIGSWASSHSSDKRVHFQDDRRCKNGFHRDGRQAYEGSYEGFRERGDAMRYTGDPRPVSSRSRGHQMYLSENDWHHHQQQHQQVPPFQRNAFARRSYHGDASRSRQRPSFRDGHSNGYCQNSDFGSDSHSIPEERGGEWAEGPSLRERAAWERRSCRSYREQRGCLDSPGHQVASPPPCRGERHSGARRWYKKHRAVAGGRHQELGGEDGFSSGEEGMWERRVDRHTARSHRPSDTGVLSRSKSTPLAMGDLQQVLLDEELARRLQDEEDGLLRRSPRQSPPSRRPHIDGDFRVAQVAQDEEIARYMQKQEIKTKRGWGEADPSRLSPDPHNPYDQRVAMQRQRQRLDSQGLPSPPEDYQPDEQPPSPVGMAAQQPVRNIAEELDPTFQLKRTENLQVGQPGLSKHLPEAQSSCYDTTEEPAFVQPTKRPNEKLGRTKAKEKKESSKQKENCKQQ